MYDQIVHFMEENQRRPSKYNMEERDMYNWWKHQKKRLNANNLKAERIEPFRKLLLLGEQCKHKNQYQ